MALSDIQSWWRKKTYTAKRVPKRMRHVVNDRQAKVNGYDYDANQAAVVYSIGAGGLGSHTNRALAQKGIRTIYAMDHDVVDPPDPTRQDFSYSDLGKLKVYACGERLAKEALFPLKFIADPRRFQEAFSPDRQPKLRPDVIICGVDNTPTRRAVSLFAHVNSIPLIVPSVGRDASVARVIVQEPGYACWGCIIGPKFVDDDGYPCNLPGSFDVNAIAVGLTLLAADSIIASRHREWNDRTVYLDGALPDRTRFAQPRPDCPICTQPTWAQPTAAVAA